MPKEEQDGQANEPQGTHYNDVTQRLLQELASRDQKLSKLEAEVANKAAKEEAPKEEFSVAKGFEEGLPQDDSDKYEHLTNKQLVTLISNTMDKALKAQQDAVTENIFKSLEPSQKKLNDIEKITAKMIANMGLNEARSKYGDFDNHRDVIGGILQQYPNMNFEDAYLLAKSKAPGKVPPKSAMETERPNIGLSLPSQAASRQGSSSSSSGVTGFRDMLDAVLDSIVK
jgi:hypothetical protein